jgi:hypothetical protein
MRHLFRLALQMYRQDLWRLLSPISKRRRLFRLPAAVVLLTCFVVQPAGFGLLIQRAGRALLFRSRQRSTRRAVPVAAVALTADHHIPMTPSAAEDPTILGNHL